MTINLNALHEMLNDKGLDNEMNTKHDCIIIPDVPTEVFIDNDGDRSLFFAMTVCPDGHYVQICASLYENSQPAHELVILKTCMQVNRRFALAQYDYYEETGVVRVKVNILLEDKHTTANQLLKAIAFMVSAADVFDSVFRSAVELGKDTFKQLQDRSSKKIKLTRLIAETAMQEQDIDRLIQELEFANASQQQGESGRGLH